MISLTHAALASFSAATTSVVFSPTGRSACVRKVVAPSRFRHEPYGARVIPILTGGSSFHASCAVPMTFTPYPSASAIRNTPSSTTGTILNTSNGKAQGVPSVQSGSVALSSPRPLGPLQQPAVSTTVPSSKWSPPLASSSTSASACNSGRSTNALSISSNCSRMGSFFLSDSIRAPLDDVIVEVVSQPSATIAPKDSDKPQPNSKKQAKRSITNPVSKEAVTIVPSATTVDSMRANAPTPIPEPAAFKADDEECQNAAGSRFAVVKFKYESATFVAPFKIAAGDVVVVEGDRGENIGTVAEIQKDAPAFAVVAKVLRRATDKDLAALKAQREREAAATLATRAVAESLGLHGRVEDAEYQFDLNKLTIFVSRPTKSTFVDFRKLQRTLFREFRCRIWCAHMDEVEAAEAGPRLR